MARADKLLAAIRANPKGVRFADACRAARLLGFIHDGTVHFSGTVIRFG